MKTIITYVAFDGTTFEDKKECMEYEWTRTHLPCAMSLWGDDWTYLDGDGTYEGVIDAYMRARYLEVANIKGWGQDLDNFSWIFGYALPGVEGPGMYKYDEYYDVWNKVKDNE